MTDKPNNPAAFPWCGDLNNCPTINLGLTLRDYFAAHAPISPHDALAHARKQGEEHVTVERLFRILALLRIVYADAMLKARDS